MDKAGLPQTEWSLQAIRNKVVAGGTPFVMRLVVGMLVDAMAGEFFSELPFLERNKEGGQIPLVFHLTNMQDEVTMEWFIKAAGLRYIAQMDVRFEVVKDGRRCKTFFVWPLKNPRS